VHYAVLFYLIKTYDSEIVCAIDLEQLVVTVINAQLSIHIKEQGLGVMEIISHSKVIKT